MTDRRPVPGLDFFWEQADAEASDEHPLERELCHRLDALERYRRMIMDAQTLGRDDMVDVLLEQHDKQARFVRRLRHALSRSSHGAATCPADDQATILAKPGS